MTRRGLLSLFGAVLAAPLAPAPSPSAGILGGRSRHAYAITGRWDGSFANGNPAHAALDMLRRGGWDDSEIDIESFERAAAYIDATVAL